MMLKLSQLLNSLEALRSLASKEFPLSTSYLIARMNNQIDKEFEILRAENQKRLEKYASLNKETKMWDYPDEEAKQKHADEYAEMTALEVMIEVPNIRPENLDGVKMEPRHLQSLEWLFGK